MPRIYVKKILFCTGLGILTPTPLEIPGIKNNVLYDINDIDVFENKNVIVLGGGDSAVDYAIQISKIAKRVVLTHRREEMRISPQKKKTLANSKVVVLLNKTPIKIKNNEAIVLKDNVVGSIESIPFDFVVVQYGHKVESNKYTYLCKLKLENGKIIVNTKQMTNIENIYACGDCCSYKNKQLTIAAGMKEVDKVLS
jgi:thioredoxin reductase (NADPH)